MGKTSGEPEAFGVVKMNANNEITELKTSRICERSSCYRIYYFKEVGDLRKELQNGFRQQHSKRREY
jgi:glucose-1-phosphate thymidylyltransferase